MTQVRPVAFTRALMAQGYIELGAIERQVLDSDGRGGLKTHDPSTPWPIVADNVPARIAKTIIHPRTATLEERLTVDGAYDICFVAGTDIRNKDRYRCHTQNERVFKIIGPRYASDEISRIMAAEEIV